MNDSCIQPIEICGSLSVDIPSQRETVLEKLCFQSNCDLSTTIAQRTVTIGIQNSTAPLNDS